MNTSCRRPSRLRAAAGALVALALVVPVTALTGQVVAAGAADETISCVNPTTESTATPISRPWGKVGVFNDTTQLFPAQLGAAYFANHGGSEAHACMARNSFGAVQVAVTATGAAATINGVSASDLTGPGDAVLDADDVRLYKAGIVSLPRMSDASFRTDLLPRNASGDCTGDCRMFDALVPTVDPATGAARAAYPETVPANETRVVWVDVLAPQGQAPGTYTGTVTVQVNSAPVLVPLTVHVVNETIPSLGSPAAEAAGTDITSEFRVASRGGMNWTKFLQYARLGLENRISLWRDGSPGMSDAEWTPVAKLLQGTDTGVRLPGSQLQSVAMSKFNSAADLTSYRNRLTAIGQVDKAWLWCDEIPADTCKADVTAARQTWSDLPLMAIPKLNSEPSTRPGGAAGDLSTVDNIRGLVPLSVYLAPHPDKQGLNPYPSKTPESRTPAFTAWRDAAAGREFWQYVSCMSEGCTTDYTPAGIYSGWPSHAIDHAGTTQPAMGWHSFRYDIDGEHYWSVNLCANAAPGAELNSCLYYNGDSGGSNGDGNLFYRSTQFNLDGTEIPLESIRLKRIRDGRQAYALLALRQADGDNALSYVTGIYPELGSSSPTAQAYDAARAALLVASDDPVVPPAGAISINDVTKAEGTGDNLTPFVFALSRTGDTGQQASVDFTVVAGTATEGVDYPDSDGGTLIFEAGSSTTTLPFAVIADSLDEPDETFSVVLSDPAGATIADGTGAATIVDDDDAPPPSYRPDSLVNVGPFFDGDDVYSPDGSTQPFERTIRKGSSFTGKWRVQNDGDVADSYSLVGKLVARGVKVTYFLGRTNITRAVRSGNYSTGVLDPGQQKTFTFVVTATRKAQVGAAHSWLLHAVSFQASPANVRDVVKMTVRVKKG